MLSSDDSESHTHSCIRVSGHAVHWTLKDESTQNHLSILQIWCDCKPWSVLLRGFDCSIRYLFFDHSREIWVKPLQLSREYGFTKMSNNQTERRFGITLSDRQLYFQITLIHPVIKLSSQVLLKSQSHVSLNLVHNDWKAEWMALQLQLDHPLLIKPINRLWLWPDENPTGIQILCIKVNLQVSVQMLATLLISPSSCSQSRSRSWGIKLSWYLGVQSWAYSVNRRGMSAQPGGAPLLITNIQEVWLTIWALWGLLVSIQLQTVVRVILFNVFFMGEAVLNAELIN